MQNIRTNKSFFRIIEIVTLTCLIVTGISLYANKSYAAEYMVNGKTHTKTTSAAIVFYGVNVDKGDGFTNSFRYITDEDIKNINDEVSADRYFSSDDFVTYLDGAKYSGKRKNDEWYLRIITQGLNLAAVADSLGADATASPSYSYDLYINSSDGYASTISKPFETQRYYFPSSDAPVQSGTAVSPGIAFECKDANDGSMIGDMPLLMFGQTSPSSDYNMQSWGKLINKVSFGAKPRVFTASVLKTNDSMYWTVADILQSKSGLYKSVYNYLDGNDEIKAELLGVPLDLLLKDKKIDLSKIESVKILGGGNKNVTVPVADLSKYFVAVDGTTAANNGSKTSIDGATPVRVYCPGEIKDKVVMDSVKNAELTLKVPAKITGLKAGKSTYNSVTLSWNKNKDADGYYIDRYDKKTAKWTNAYADIQNPGTISFTDRNLKTGTKYSYRIRAYMIVGSLEIEGSNSAVVSKTPALQKSKIKSAKKSGKANIVVKWSKVAGASGYKVYRSTKKAGKYKKISTIKKGSTVKLMDKKLKKKKTYYYKIRAYRNVNGKKIYSQFTSIKKVRR